MEKHAIYLFFRFVRSASLMGLMFLFWCGSVQGQPGRQSYALKMAQTFNWIENLYVDTIQWDEFSEQVIRETLQKLDPHSAYISAEDARGANETLQGRFEGIGISYGMLHDSILVVSVVPEGPSHKVGLQQGDRILRVDGRPVAGVGIRSEQIHDLLRGRRGSEVQVDVLRPSSGLEFSFRVVRDRIPIYSVEAAYEIAPGVAYIKLSRFSSTSAAEFRNALKELGPDRTQSLILDLTGNTGGYLEAAVELTNEFLQSRSLMVFTEGTHQPRREFRATGSGSYQQGNLVVLIDQATASASEILAGAVQDWDRGVLIGRRTYGKGLVQRQLTYPDGSMLRLTVSRYFTPSGRMIQKPYEEGTVAYRREVLQRQDTVDYAPDSLRFFTFLKQRAVYGGGGISPDIVVPSAPEPLSPYSLQMSRQGIISDFSVHYFDRNRERILRDYPTLESFLEGFACTEQDLEGLKEHALEAGLIHNAQEFARDVPRLCFLLKAVLARDLWEAFYRVYNQQDPIVLRALEAISQWDQTLQEVGLR